MKIPDWAKSEKPRERLLEKGPFSLTDSELLAILIRNGTRKMNALEIARALLAEPDIFVMDEATSSVDTLTEALIQKGMLQLMTGRTSFIIAHRLSTIKSADQIFVIEDGQIAESGSHKSLIQQRGIYYNLYTKQFRHDLESRFDPFGESEVKANSD